jgi:hypothetical protein
MQFLDSFPDLEIPHFSRINSFGVSFLIKIMFPEKVKVVYEGVESNIWRLKLNRLPRLVPLSK